MSLKIASRKGNALLKTNFELFPSEYLRKLNRFVLEVDINGKRNLVYMPNPGKLSTILHPGRKLLLKHKIKGRYNYEVFAADLKSCFVTIDPKLANIFFASAIEKKLLSGFENFDILAKEKMVGNFGRIDFILSSNNEMHFVEVKSCTHVENGIAKFPDRQTERGRRQLEALISLSKKDVRTHLFIVIQRPDAKFFIPYKEIDPLFSNLFYKASKLGVRMHAISTEFDPLEGKCYLRNPQIEILGGNR